MLEASGRSVGAVQSIERAFGLLELLTVNGGTMALSQMAATSGLPAPTIHRLIRTLVGLGYVRQEPNRQYTLGPRLLIFANSVPTMLSFVGRPHLQKLVDALGESANLAMLDGDDVVYIAQAQSKRSMRMFTEVGRRVQPHCTAVGKAMMAEMDEVVVADVMDRTQMPRHTERTITNLDDFLEELRLTRERGYALDNGEQELGVRCVAVRVPATGTTRLGISISGPEPRMTDQFIESAVPALQEAASLVGAAFD